MKITKEELKKVKFFEHYNDKQLATLSRISTVKEFKVKQIVFEQYDTLSEVYILLEGSVALGISLSKTKRIILGSVEEGQMFSWSAVFHPFISTAWVMSLTPSKVIAVDAKKLKMEIEKDCDFGLKTMYRIAQTISLRLSDTRFQLINQLSI